MYSIMFTRGSHVWDLLGGEVRLQPEGLSLSAEWSRQLVDMPGRIGQFKAGDEYTGDAIEGSMSLRVIASKDRREKARRDFLDALIRGGRLFVESERGITRWTDVYLSGQVPDPSLQPVKDPAASMEVGVAAADGCWFTTLTFTNGQQVVNSGFVPVWPRIKWKTGGQVRCPSGATFALPAVDSGGVLNTAPRHSYKVTDWDGHELSSMWDQLRSEIVADPVPIGSSSSWGLPTGAELLVDQVFPTPFG